MVKTEHPGYWKWLWQITFTSLRWLLNFKCLKSLGDPRFECYVLGCLCAFPACVLASIPKDGDWLLPLWSLGISIPAFFFFVTHGSYRSFIESKEVKDG